MKTIKLGDQGYDVSVLQKYLSLVQDQHFGKLTQEAVIAYQRSHNLNPDGIVGPATWTSLELEFGSHLSPKRTTRKVKEIILHCSATPQGRHVDIATITKWHKQRGWATIGYHYVIYLDGTIHEGRDINKVGAHCENHNTGSIGICYIGGLSLDGKTAKDTRTDKQKTSLLSLVHQLMAMYNLPLSAIHCHNEYAAKACPSFKIADFRKAYQATYH